MTDGEREKRKTNMPKLNYRKETEITGSTNEMGILFGQITCLIQNVYHLRRPDKKEHVATLKKFFFKKVIQSVIMIVY